MGNSLRRGPGGAKPATLNNAASRETTDLSKSLDVLNSALKDEIAKGDVRLKLDARGLVIGLNATTLFSVGDDEIHSSFYSTIQKLSDVLNELPNSLRLEGHTDSLPINTPRFRSNWELSAARSIAMLRLLSGRFHVDPSRMSIVGCADGDAIDSNDTEEGRRKNRRVDIVVLADSKLDLVPGNSQAKASAEPTESSHQNH